MNWALYTGGPDEYVCGGKSDFAVAVIDFVQSNRCLAQSFFYTFFTFATCYWATVLSLLEFRQFYLVTRGKEFHPVSHPWPVILHVVGWTLSLSCSLPFVIYASLNPPLDQDQGTPFMNILSGTTNCLPAPFSVGFLYYIPQTIIVCVCLISILACFWMVWGMGDYRNTFVRSQWRVLIFLIIFIVPFLLYEAMMAKAIYYFAAFTNRFTFANCVASHPRVTPSPCIQQYWPFYIFDLFTMAVFFSWGIIVAVLIYFTNSQVFEWWEHCFRRGAKENTPRSRTSTIQRKLTQEWPEE